MTKEGKFGSQDAIMLLTITITAKVFYTSPAMVVRQVGTAGWYMTLISAAAACLGFTFVYFLLKRFPGSNIMEIFDSVLGKYVGFFFSFILAAALLFTASITARECSDVMKVYNYVKTPPSFILLFFVIAVVILSFLGLESISRCSKIFAYILLSGYVITLILAIQNYQIHRLFPILGYGLGATVYNGIVRSSAYGEVIIAGIFAKSLHGTNEIKKAGYLSIIFSGLIISASLLAFSLTFSYYFGKEITAPVYSMASIIDFGFIFQRVEAIFLFIWNISTIISTTALFYMVLLIYCHLFKINDKRPIIIPFAILLYAVALIPKGIMDIMQRYVQYLRDYNWIVFYFMPAVVLITAALRKKKGDVKNA